MTPELLFEYILAGGGALLLLAWLFIAFFM
jgi:hypothetical protein